MEFQFEKAWNVLLGLFKDPLCQLAPMPCTQSGLSVRSIFVHSIIRFLLKDIPFQDIHRVYLYRPYIGRTLYDWFVSLFFKFSAVCVLNPNSRLQHAACKSHQVFPTYYGKAVLYGR